MSTASLVRQEPRHIEQWKSPSQIKDRIHAIQQLMTQVLKKDTDFGIIPGMPKGTKPSLWKPGSEQILAMFQIAVEPVVEDLSTSDCYRYRVTTRLTNVQTGEFLGAGVGEASTDETKYKWRRTYSKPEFDGTDPERRRIKYGRYKEQGSGDWIDTQEMQVRQEPADLANTILKMAKKRSQIDATLTVTGASSMFEQDLEDLPEETRQEMAAQRGGKKKQDVVGDVMCAHCRAINGHLPSCPTRLPQGQATASPSAQSATSVAPTEASPSSFTRIAVRIMKVITRTKAPLRRVLVLTNDGEVEMSVWHASLHPVLDELQKALAAGQGVGQAIIEYSSKEKDGKVWSNMESVIELDGVKFVDNKPAEEF